MGSRCRTCALVTLVAVGIPLLVAGIIVAALGSFRDLAEDEIKKGVPLKAGSTSFENWERPEGELFIKYYLFNITNPNAGKIPEIKQRGPYTYREVSFNNVTERKGDTLTYDPSTKYFYDPARSCKTCDPHKDQITTINYPLLAILQGISLKLQQVKQRSVSLAETQAAIIYKNLLTNGIHLFQKRSVHQVLWGYKDSTFSAVASGIINSSVPQDYALQFNNSGSGLTKINTGEEDVDRVAEYLEWKTLSSLPWWNSFEANMINGTGGTRHRPLIEKEELLYAFVTEICRSMKFTYESTVKLHGIELYRYTIPKEVFENGDINPENKGFCVTGPQKKCLPSGLLDVNPCKGGQKAPPFVASGPHFYPGDDALSKRFNLDPQQDKHATFLDVEPNTGVTMRGHKRLQLNLAISSFLIKNILLNVNTSNPVMLPVFFTDESAEISKGDADDFKMQVLLPLRVADAMPYVMIALGAVFLFVAVIIVVVSRKQKEKAAVMAKGDMVMENYTSHKK